NRRRLSGPGLRSFLAIADLWGLTEEQRRLVLGLPSRSTYHAWVKTVREHGDITLGVDVLLRISAMLGIHQALGICSRASATESNGCARRIARRCLVARRRWRSSLAACRTGC